ncbi:conserved Plasmodium protein, unknown function [Plasmodium chabaudi chabaudi]|uniref:Uncharacterized protein n=1 Tax=Plasmodium chabaudi chabaudi TaxID=31271 RepID=A0A4V0K9P3_PLACU|nr:conserved Plasmodium protein, unknown function [Plasmodium chabaudi chabaudi]VTZ69931.1 conserved Plasmodium protein, unknown function [Plasmodium chabaudi chabaudi]|eukprot:XP_731882.2 conserved Plasmodium protein, unknown function [Plasmodium chabaudi chabaudi]
MDTHRKISNTNKNTETKHPYFYQNYEYNFFSDKYDFDGDLFSPNPSFLYDPMDYHNNKSNHIQKRTDETLNNEHTYNNSILNINKTNIKENNKTRKNVVNINNYNDKFSKVNFMHKLKRNVHNPKNRECNINTLKQNVNADYYGATNAPQNENDTSNDRNNIPINYKISSKLLNTTDDTIYGDNNNNLGMSRIFQIDNKYIHTARMNKNDKNTLLKNRILFYDNSKFYYKSYINKMSKIKGKFNSNLPENIQIQLKRNDTNKGIDNLNNKFEYTLDIKNKLPSSFMYSNRSDNFKNFVYSINSSNGCLRNNYSQKEKEKYTDQLLSEKNNKLKYKNELSYKKNKETNHFNISTYINRYLYPKQDCKEKQSNIVLDQKKNLKDNLIYLSVNPKEENNIYNIHDLKGVNDNVKNSSMKNNNLGYKYPKLRNSYDINQTRNMVIKKDNSNDDIDQKNTKLKIYENLEIFENEFLNKNCPKDYTHTNSIDNPTLFIENNKKTKFNESNSQTEKNTNHQKHTQNKNQENDKVQIINLGSFNEANKIKENNEIKSDNRKHVINIPINFNLKRNFKGYKNYIETKQKKNKKNNNPNALLNGNHRKSLHMDNLKKNTIVNFNKSEINDKEKFKNSPLINKISNEQNVHIENVFDSNQSFKSNDVKEVYDSYNINENNKENNINEQINTSHENLMNQEQVLQTNDPNDVNHNSNDDNINTSFEENTNLYSNALNFSLHDKIIFKNYCNISEDHHQLEELKPKDSNNKIESNIEQTLYKQINGIFNKTTHYIKNENNDNSNNHEILSTTPESNYKSNERQISNIIKTDFQYMDEKNDTNSLYDISSNKINDEMIKEKKCNHKYKIEPYHLSDSWDCFKNVFSSNSHIKNDHDLSLNEIEPNEKDNVIENSFKNALFLDDDTTSKKKSNTEYNGNNSGDTTILINKFENEINPETSNIDEQNEYITNIFNIFDNIKSDHEMEEANNTKHDIIINEVNNNYSEGLYLNNIFTQTNENANSNKEDNKNIYLMKEIEINPQININHAKNNNNTLEIQYNAEEQKDITPKDIKDTDKEYFSDYTESQNENTKREPIENIIQSESEDFISMGYNKNDEIRIKEHKISDDETFFTKETISNDMDIIENEIEENNFTQSIENIINISNSNNFKSNEEEDKAKWEFNNLVENVYLKENHEYDNKLKYSIPENIQIIKTSDDDIEKEITHQIYETKENNKNGFHKRVDKHEEHNAYTNNEIINEFNYLYIKINKYNLFNSLNINADRLNYINSLYNSFDYFNKTNDTTIYNNDNDTNKNENLELHQKLFENKLIKIFDFSLQENHLINNNHFDTVDTQYENDYINEHCNKDTDHIHNIFDNAPNDTKNASSIKSSTLNDEQINHISDKPDSDLFNTEESKVKESQNTVLKDSSEKCNNMKKEDNHSKQDEGSDDENEDILYEDIKRNIWIKNNDFNKNIEKENAMKYIQIESTKCIILFCNLYKIKYFQGMHDMIISLFYLNLHPHEILCVFEKILHYYAPYLYLQNQDYYIHTIKNEYQEVNHNKSDISIQISNYNGKLFRLLCQFFFPYVSFFFDTSISDNWPNFFFVNLNFSKFNNVYFLLFKWMKLIEIKDEQNSVTCDFILYLLSFFKYKLKLIKNKIYEKETENGIFNNFKKYDETNDKIEISNKNIKQKGGEQYHKYIEETTKYDEIGQKVSDIKNEISRQDKSEHIENNKIECKDTTNYEHIENNKIKKENIRKNKLSTYCTNMFSAFFEFNSSFDDKFENNYNIHIEEIIKDIKNVKKYIPLSIINFIQNYNSMYQKKEFLLKPEENYYEKWKLSNDISKSIDENICLNIKISDLFHFHNNSRYYEFIFIKLIGDRIILSKLNSITPNNLAINNFIELKGVYEFLNYKQKLKHTFKNKNKLLYIIIQNNKENDTNFINHNFNELAKKTNINKEKNYSNDKNMNKRLYLNKVFLKRNNKDNPNINENVHNNTTDKITFHNFFTTLKKNNFKYVTILQETPDLIITNIDKKNKNTQKQIDKQENTNKDPLLKENSFIFQMLKKVKNKIYKNDTINDDLNKYTHSKNASTQDNNLNYVLKDYNFKIFNERRIRKITNYKNKKIIRYPKNDIRKKKSDKIKKSKTQDDENNEHHPMNQNEEKDLSKSKFPKNVSHPIKKYNEMNYSKLGSDLKELNNLKNHKLDLNIKKKNIEPINISPNIKNNIMLKKVNKPKLFSDDNELNNIMYYNLRKEKTENIQKKYILPTSKKNETHLTKNELANTITHPNSKTNTITKENNDKNIGKNEKKNLNTEKQKTFFETQESFFNDLLLDKVTHNKEHNKEHN